MITPLTFAEQAQAVLAGMRVGPAALGGEPFDALQVVRSESGLPETRGWLRVTRLAHQEGVYAWVLGRDGGQPQMQRVPREEIVWLLHGKARPARRAIVDGEDPLLALQGEADGIRIRCLAGLDQTAIIPPTELVGLLRGFDLVPRLRSPHSNVMHCGMSRRKGFVLLAAEHHDGEATFREGSVGLSLAIWYLTFGNKVNRVVDWSLLAELEPAAAPGFFKVLNAYQAMRLPALRLFLEARASHLPKSVFVRDFANEHKLPIPLVARRMSMISKEEFGFYP